MVRIKTERLTIFPMTENELTQLINKYSVAAPELSSAYREMLNNCIQFPEQYVWYAAWKICLADSGKEVGYAGFKGFNGGCPEIGYGINDEYEGVGFATDAVKALCNWAFQMPEVVAVEAETESDNVKSIRVLKKTGFVQTGVMGEEGPRYILNKQSLIQL